MKRTFTQTITVKKTGQLIAARELEYDETAETYHRPVFVAQLMNREEQFLEEILEVTTNEKGE